MEKLRRETLIAPRDSQILELSRSDISSQDSEISPIQTQDGSNLQLEYSIQAQMTDIYE